MLAVAGCSRGQPGGSVNGFDGGPDAGPSDGGRPSTPPRLCKEPVLQRMPVPVEYVHFMGQLGSLVPPDHTFPTPHFYFYTKNPFDATDIEAPVFAPADLVLEYLGLRHYARLRGGTADYTDYYLTARVCDDVDLYFIHLRSITEPSLAALIDAQRARCAWLADAGSNTGGGTEEQTCDVTLPGDPVLVRAGEPIGTAGDIRGVGGLDMGLHDMRDRDGRDFAKPDHMCPTGYGAPIHPQCYAECPLDYVDEMLAAPYRALFGYGPDQPAQVEPLCGKVHWDIAGTAQGYWFTATPTLAGESEQDKLFMARSPLTDAVYVFSMDNALAGVAGGLYGFAPRNGGQVNRRFGEISDQSVYCFEGPGHGEGAVLRGWQPWPFVLVLGFTPDGVLQIQKQDREDCGNGPYAFLENPARFTR